MKFDIITIFPEQIEHFIQYGIFRIAQNNGVEIKVHDLRKWTDDNHKTVDDRPYGGGAGMVMKIEPVYKALKEIKTKSAKVIAMVPHGIRLDQQMLRGLSAESDADYILLCGHYEGFDQRILDNLVDYEISVGDYVLSGGELPTLTLIDGIIRLLPGVLGNESSSVDESFENNLLEYPHYTRPEKFNGWSVPETLLTGNHKEIEIWRRDQSLIRTRKNRPDLLDYK